MLLLPMVETGGWLKVVVVVITEQLAGNTGRRKNDERQPDTCE